MAMVAVYTRVRAVVEAGGFPLLYGGDCSVLLGAVPVLRDVCGTAGLLFVDAHEDATTIEQSTTGEAANMEIALLLGMTGDSAPEPLRSRLPALRPDAIAMLGQRGGAYRDEIGVASIAGRVRIHGAAELRPDPEPIAAEAVGDVGVRSSAWWLHVDLDVLAGQSSAPAAPPTIRRCRKDCPGSSSQPSRRPSCRTAPAGAGASGSTIPTSIRTATTQDGSFAISPRSLMRVSRCSEGGRADERPGSGSLRRTGWFRAP